MRRMRKLRMRWVVVTVELAVAAFVTSVTASGPHEPDQQRGALSPRRGPTGNDGTGPGRRFHRELTHVFQ